MSSSDIAVSVRGLGKSYTIVHDQEKHNTLAETMLSRVRNPFNRPKKETFWALKDVSFDIKQGEVVGIIGRNGAGKSTLLKILSRITEPTHGEIDLYGRVGSLLEVGTGFHPELTGRENIFLNGAVLGMSKGEIRKQFDAIVDFAGVEQFLDTPVKRYSSGMYVRLAFAVAAHLNSEILIVDEVLAVGDAEFQKKCIGKMKDVARMDGRTVLFVSHNMAAITQLCRSAILLQQGNVALQGAASDVARSYSAALLDSSENRELRTVRERSGSGGMRLTTFSIENSAGLPLGSVGSGEDVVFVVGYELSANQIADRVDVGVSFTSSMGQLLCVLYSSYKGKLFRVSDSEGQFRCRVEKFPLAPGQYVVHGRVLIGGDEADWPKDGIGTIVVEPGSFYGTTHAGFGAGAPLLVNGDWEHEPSEQNVLVP